MRHAKQLHNRRYCDDYLEILNRHGLPGHVKHEICQQVREGVVVLKHALRNASLPIITLSGVLFGFLLSGTVVVEQAFNVPGLGKAMVEAFVMLDYAVVQNLVLLYGVVFVILNLGAHHHHGGAGVQLFRGRYPGRLCPTAPQQ